MSAWRTLGNVAATTPLALLVARAGWRRAFLAIAALTAVLALAFAALVRERPPGARGPGAGPPPPLGETVRRLVGRRDYWIISLGAFCRYGSYASIRPASPGPHLDDLALALARDPLEEESPRGPSRRPEPACGAPEPQGG